MCRYKVYIKAGKIISLEYRDAKQYFTQLVRKDSKKKKKNQFGFSILTLPLLLLLLHLFLPSPSIAQKLLPCLDSSTLQQLFSLEKQRKHRRVYFSHCFASSSYFAFYPWNPEPKLSIRVVIVRTFYFFVFCRALDGNDAFCVYITSKKQEKKNE